MATRLGLPPLIPIDGIGNEIYHEWAEMMFAELRDEEVPGGDVGEYSDDEDRALFNEWVREASSPAVQATIARLRALPPTCRRIAILDDVYQFGNVTLGVAPALYKAAYGNDFDYDRANNRFMFWSVSWLADIVRATFLTDIPNLAERQIHFLRPIAKGKLDWVEARQFDPNDIHSLDPLADLYAHKYQEYGRETSPPEVVYQLIERYGLNLFQLHGSLQSALAAHTHEVLSTPPPS